jgi:nucleotide-binding universal stress UspA family protein
MYQSILVPLDGSPVAEQAIPYAATLARHSGATLQLITVSTPLEETSVEGLFISAAEIEQELANRYRTYLSDLAGRLQGVQVTTDVPHGDAGAILCDRIDNTANLAVMVTHGRGAFERFMLGSTTDEVICQVKKPVLLVRPGEGPVALDQEPTLTPALVALDGTPEAEGILEHVVELVSLLPQAEVVLVQVVRGVDRLGGLPDVPVARVEAGNIRQQLEQLQGKLQTDARAYLDGLTAPLLARGIKARSRVLVGDQPAQAILEEAKNLRAGLIAMETHGRTGLSRLVLGSVADRVIRSSTVPVLLSRRVN